MSLMVHLCDISFLVRSQSCVSELLTIALKCGGRLKDTEETEKCRMVSGCFSDFILYDVPPSPIFVLCMCSFLTRSRGNAHSSSSSICSVNSLWVITSLLQFLNPPITLLSPLLFCCQTPIFFWCHHCVIVLCESSKRTWQLFYPHLFW